MPLLQNQEVPDFSTEDVLGNPIHLHSLRGKKIFIAFLRNTHCPLCNFHLFKLTHLADKLKENNTEILVFYESDKKMFEYSPFFKDRIFKDNKITIISDPQRKIYDLFGAEINPEKATLEALKNAGRFAEVQEAAQLGITGDGQEAGTNPDAIPADFLIDEQLIIQYAHYGNDAGDNINLKLVESFAVASK